MYAIKQFIAGNLQALTVEEAQQAGKQSSSCEVDEHDLLYYVSWRSRDRPRGGTVQLRLVVPSTLHGEVLQHYHTSLQGAHQGVVRTYARVREWFYWPGLYRSVCDFVAGCIDCQTGKGAPRERGRSPGNIPATYPFQVLGMDHIPSLPRSHAGNTELLVWVDQHTGYVITKATSSRSAQTIAEAYEAAVFRHFGASEVIRHDREPGFMSAVFRAFNRLIGQRSRATLAYRPQANGITERMVQTISRAIKLYVKDRGQKDWDEYAERLPFALNKAVDRVRGDTPCYLLFGWEPRSTIETMVPARMTNATTRPRSVGEQLCKRTIEVQAPLLAID
ncbi:TPA: hypothetical protein N0F65_011703 [Lagenidium giganteum]|uniref:Integrase catalytic domain-containing protein n=1 Tax=Lagenidium giganteum TaxID=4803 RepID=A0AAV2YVQ9_9STRA|nr:TPA: hypothetical protein N0F65_011703 [Lagenidium giganteum]